VFNLSNHSYFILDQDQDVSDYLLEINAFHRIQTDHQLLPTGKLLSLKNDAYHFSPPKKNKSNRTRHAICIEPYK